MEEFFFFSSFNFVVARLKELTKELAATKKKLDNQAETLSIGLEESSLGSRWMNVNSLSFLSFLKVNHL